MDDLRASAMAFLAVRRVAVAGVARDGRNPANLIYRRLRQEGYEVFPINPRAAEVEGDPCYGSVLRIPGAVEGVVIATPPAATLGIVEDCVAAGVPRVWFHRSFGAGSVSDEAVELCRREGIAVIPGACPMMFLDPVDVGHRCMRWVLGMTRNLPKTDAGAQYSPTSF
jgi:uncharacterized protein